MADFMRDRTMHGVPGSPRCAAPRRGGHAAAGGGTALRRCLGWGAACALAVLLGTGVASAAGAGLSPSAGASRVDDRGHPVRLSAPPRRIVSLLPSLTESVCALGACDRLVGVDRYSSWPASVRALPQLGGGLDPNVEAVLALKPDLVLLATSSRAVTRFESLGLQVITLEARTHADVQRTLELLGQVLGIADAQRVWRDIDAGVSAAAQAVPPSARGARVYFEVNAAPYAAGPSSFIGETLTRLGARNIVPAELGPFPRLSPEFVVRADPDLIMIGDRQFQGLSQRPGWAALRAVREQRLCVLTPEQSDMLARPGPRIAEAARLMGDCLARLARKAAP